jgi:Flp pilus assembly protein TadG
MAMGSLRRLARSNGGAAAVEFAIIVWVLIFVCLGVIEFGRGLHVRNEMSFAGDRAARKILTTDPLVSDRRSIWLKDGARRLPRPQEGLLEVSSFGTRRPTASRFAPC